MMNKLIENPISGEQAAQVREIARTLVCEDVAKCELTAEELAYVDAALVFLGDREALRQIEARKNPVLN
jgi:hypothetical protein